jgi:hypothetical protein
LTRVIVIALIATAYGLTFVGTFGGFGFAYTFDAINSTGLYGKRTKRAFWAGFAVITLHCACSLRTCDSSIVASTSITAVFGCKLLSFFVLFAILLTSTRFFGASHCCLAASTSVATIACRKCFVLFVLFVFVGTTFGNTLGFGAGYFAIFADTDIAFIFCRKYLTAVIRFCVVFASNLFANSPIRTCDQTILTIADIAIIYCHK